MVSLPKKRLAAFFAVAGLCALPLFADWTLCPQEEARPVQALEYSLAFSAPKGLEGDRVFCAFGYCFDFAPYEAFVGFQSCGNISDITLSSAWWAVRSEHAYNVWNFGIEGIYHYQKYEDVYGEHDAVFYYNVRSQRTNGFSLVIKSGVTVKAANIYAVDEIIWNTGTMGLVQVGKTWKSGFELYTSVASHDTYRYPLFLAPKAIIGTAYTFGCVFRPCMELELGFTDFFATAVYINTLLVRFSARVLL